MHQTSILHLIGFLFAITAPVFIAKEFYFIALMCTLACMTCIAHQPPTAQSVRNHS